MNHQACQRKIHFCVLVILEYFFSGVKKNCKKWECKKSIGFKKIVGYDETDVWKWNNIIYSSFLDFFLCRKHEMTRSQTLFFDWTCIFFHVYNALFMHERYENWIGWTIPIFLFHFVSPSRKDRFTWKVYYC